MSFPPGPPAFLRAVKPPPPHLAHNRLAAKTTMLGVSIHRLYETFLSSKVVGLAVIPHVFLGQSGPNGYLAVAESTLTKLGYLFFLIVCHWHDSILLKQIADKPIEKILEQYESSSKQVFIAFDKVSSYSSRTQELLNKTCILRLSPEGNELYGRP